MGLSQAAPWGRGSTDSGCFGIGCWREGGVGRAEGREAPVKVSDRAPAHPPHLEWGLLSQWGSLVLDPRLSDPWARS